MDNLGKFFYVFAVNKFQDRSNGKVQGEFNESNGKYDETNIPAPIDSTSISASNAKVFLYSPNYLSPILDINIPSEVNDSNVIGVYDNSKTYNWWILFCVDGTKGISSLRLVNRFSDTQPNSVFCSDLYSGKITLSTGSNSSPSFLKFRIRKPVIFSSR